MTLSELAGEHVLSGVDLGTGPKGEYDAEAPNTITFVLDGRAYRVTENPEDGYRSSMRDIEAVEDTVSNRFPPVKVLASYLEKREEPYGSACDILQIRDAANGALILEVGTTNTEDYYPSFVGAWSPEKMACNVGRS